MPRKLEFSIGPYGPWAMGVPLLVSFHLSVTWVPVMLYSDAFDQRCGVGILRLREGLDRSPAKPTVIGGIQELSQLYLCHCSELF